MNPRSFFCRKTRKAFLQWKFPSKPGFCSVTVRRLSHFLVSSRLENAGAHDGEGLPLRRLSLLFQWSAQPVCFVYLSFPVLTFASGHKCQ